MPKTKSFIRFLNDSDKEKLKGKSCLFTISVGQQTHEGEHFRATIELLNDTFKNCIMLVDDSLQRHTMAINQDNAPEYYYEMSIKEGELWLQRNEKYYGQLTNLAKIIRWDTWLQHPDFHLKRNAILNLIEQDPTYKIAFEQSINEFTEKLQKRTTENKYVDIDRAKKLSFDFIVEECTALCLWPELNCNYEVYPNLHNSAINETRKRFVLAHTPDLINQITLGFRNASQLKPQRFIILEQMTAI